MIPLVEALFNEAGILEYEIEIVCIDDASDINYKGINKEIKQNKNFVYKELSVNVGRSKIRNLLVQTAKYENLLFLDCDVIPLTNNFIKNYITALKIHDVVFGGVSYDEKAEYNSILHYKYGKERETKLEFITQNFALKKSIFNKIKFDESINKYGFEDLIFYKSIKANGLSIFKINNAVIHNGIVKDNQEYLRKEEESLNTLRVLYLKKKISSDDVKLLKYFSILKKTKTLGVYKFIFNTVKNQLLKNLTSKNPSLFLFDIYRLGYFSKR